MNKKKTSPRRRDDAEDRRRYPAEAPAALLVDEAQAYGAADPSGEADAAPEDDFGGMDYTVFDNSEQAKARRRAEVRRRLEWRRGKTQHKTVKVLRLRPLAFLLAAAAAGLCVLMLTSYARVTVLNDRIAKTQASCEKLATANQDLRVTVDNRHNLEEIKEYAQNELGMQPMNSDQLEYVELGTEEVIDVVNGNDEGASGIRGWIGRLIGILRGE